MSSNKKDFTVVMGCDTFAPDVNGAARFTERLCAGLIAKGINVEVVAPAVNKKDYGARIEKIEGTKMLVHRIKSHKLWVHEWIRFVMPWVAHKNAKKLLDELKPDAVHVQSHILIGRALALAAAKRNITLIATNHVMPENILDLKRIPGFIKKPLLKIGWADLNRIVSKAAKVTTPTRKAADFLEVNTSVRGVIPISCGLDAGGYEYKIGRKSENRIVFVGRLNQEKQIDIALRALAQCDPELNIQFDVIGGGDQRANLERLAKDLGVENSVHWHGKTSDEKLRQVLTNGSIFVMPSIAELQSIATLEAMASGLPIIVANAMALPHLVDEGKNGYLFTPGNALELSGRIEQILRLNDEDYQAMQKASLEMVATHDIERTLTAFEKLYRTKSG